MTEKSKINYIDLSRLLEKMGCDDGERIYIVDHLAKDKLINDFYYSKYENSIFLIPKKDFIDCFLSNTEDETLNKLKNEIEQYNQNVYINISASITDEIIPIIK